MLHLFVRKHTSNNRSRGRARLVRMQFVFAANVNTVSHDTAFSEDGWATVALFEAYRVPEHVAAAV